MGTGRGCVCRIGVVQLVLISIMMRWSFMQGQPLHPGDAQALQSLRRSFGDLPGSSFFTSWTEGKDMCTYSGVVCALVPTDTLRRVVVLDLGFSSGNSPGLAGYLNPAIGHLTGLRQLTLAPGRVSGTLPDTLGNLASLQYLGLSKNFFSGSIPSSLATLTNVRTLDLSYNRLQGNIPAGLAHLPSLTALMLAHNLLSGTLPALTVPPLTHLDLKNNDLEGDLPSLPATLNHLSLSQNRFTGSLQPIANLRSLRYVDLSMNRLTGGIPSTIFSFNLNSLFLQRNSLSGPISPGGLVHIPTVDLSFNALTGAIPPFLAFVQNLYLNNNHFTGVVPQEFVDQLMSSSLQTLFLQHNYLSQFRIDPDSSLPLSCTFCIQYNCMMPPIKSPCPVSAGHEPARPASQCDTLH